MATQAFQLAQVEASTNQLADQQMPVYNLASKILCQVINVSLKAEPDTDEVFAQVTLLPESNVCMAITLSNRLVGFSGFSFFSSRETKR
ncbi:auxin response factor 2B-like [Pyrus x bretschneideri]|uniref:auxin response factor 2B-like n=1 Tax=Pyrus x bretschneideri TaxID=225117 RepID=UPI00202E67EB|nr:auxin response factor 2B-like [Pyrus x bretschneideri]